MVLFLAELLLVFELEELEAPPEGLLELELGVGLADLLLAERDGVF